jgi:hypothetical protein
VEVGESVVAELGPGTRSQDLSVDTARGMACEETPAQSKVQVDRGRKEEAWARKDMDFHTRVQGA